MVEPSLGGKMEQEGATAGSSRNGKKRQRKVAKVQILYETCKDVFFNAQAGTVPSPEDVDRIRFILDKMKPADVGLNTKLPSSRITEPRRAPRISYLPIFQCPKFSIAIFCLPPSGVIPLHNHPGMTVFSKLLGGSMHIKSYDWVDAPENFPQHPKRRLAKVKKDGILTAPCETSILYPADGGNMHCFTAKTGCIVLDVLGPPYSDPEDPEGRHCQYFNAFSCSKSGDAAIIPGEDEYAWLEEKFDNFVVVRGQYIGPKVVE